MKSASAEVSSDTGFSSALSVPCLIEDRRGAGDEHLSYDFFWTDCQNDLWRPAGGGDVAEPAVSLTGLLRELRRAGLTQQELADAAAISQRTVSDLERGVATVPQKETIRLLADALRLIGPERAEFERVARGRSLPSGSEAAVAAAAATRSMPRDVASFGGRQRELEQLAMAALAAGGVVSIHAIGGMAGVGKTAFAVRAAHRLAGQSPAGSYSSRCTDTPRASGRSTQPMPWPACCRHRGSARPGTAGPGGTHGTVAGPGRQRTAAAGPGRRCQQRSGRAAAARQRWQPGPGHQSSPPVGAG
jgi:transcriptional regulator with XRE-family HTH domain